MISLILAHDENYGIGLNNNLPWGKPFSEDMKWFREHTLNKSIAMGRKTFESIGKPLPKRKSIILTRNSNFSVEQYDSCFLAKSVNRLINFYSANDFELMVIGGGQVYNAFLPYATRLYVTEVSGQYNCDTYFSGYRDLDLSLTYIKEAYDESRNASLKFKIYDIK